MVLPAGSAASAERIPTLPPDAVPAVTAAQMAEIDRLAIDVYGISLLQMMELAGSHLADLAASLLDGDLRGRRVLVAVGPGNNGGGGLAAARHLANRGVLVRVVLARPARRLSEAGRHQLATLLQMGVSCCMAVHDISDQEIHEELAATDLIIDAVLGYRGRGAPHAEVATLLDHIRSRQDRLLSLDLPSGVDPDSGIPAPGAVQAAATLTLALPKVGLITDAGREQTRDLYLADIGLPAALYAHMGLNVDTPFSRGDIVRLAGPT